MSNTPFNPESEVRFQALEGNQIGSFNVGASTEVSSVNGSALSTTKLLSQITSAGVETRTLGAPSADGVFKIVTMTAFVGNVTIALTNFSTGTTATFSGVGQSMVSVSAGGKWVRVGGSAAIT